MDIMYKQSDLMWKLEYGKVIFAAGFRVKSKQISV